MSIVRVSLKARYEGEEGFRIRILAITDEETGKALDLTPFDTVQLDVTVVSLVPRDGGLGGREVGQAVSAATEHSRTQHSAARPSRNVGDRET